MRALNDLSKQERFELYKSALIDWQERPNDLEADTEDGLCNYFLWKNLAYTRGGLAKKCKEWIDHVESKTMFEYIGEPGDPIPRIAALKAMIAQLEEELK